MVGRINAKNTHTKQLLLPTAIAIRQNCICLPTFLIYLGDKILRYNLTFIFIQRDRHSICVGLCANYQLIILLPPCRLLHSMLAYYKRVDKNCFLGWTIRMEQSLHCMDCKKISYFIFLFFCSKCLRWFDADISREKKVSTFWSSVSLLAQLSIRWDHITLLMKLWPTPLACAKYHFWDCNFKKDRINPYLRRLS